MSGLAERAVARDDGGPPAAPVFVTTNLQGFDVYSSAETEARVAAWTAATLKSADSWAAVDEFFAAVPLLCCSCKLGADRAAKFARYVRVLAALRDTIRGAILSAADGDRPFYALHREAVAENARLRALLAESLTEGLPPEPRAQAVALYFRLRPAHRRQALQQFLRQPGEVDRHLLLTAVSAMGTLERLKGLELIEPFIGLPPATGLPSAEKAPSGSAEDPTLTEVVLEERGGDPRDVAARLLVRLSALRHGPDAEAIKVLLPVLELSVASASASASSSVVLPVLPVAVSVQEEAPLEGEVLLKEGEVLLKEGEALLQEGEPTPPTSAAAADPRESRPGRSLREQTC